MAKRRIKSSVKKALFGFLAFVIFGIVILCFLYQLGLKPVAKKSSPVEFKVSTGETYLTIAKNLKKQNLIKSELVYKIYVKMHKPTNIKAGTFSLNQNMGVKTLIDALKGESHSSDQVVRITFPEGKNMRQIAKIIADKTNNKEEDLFSLLQNQNYLKELVNKYWFLDDNILNTKLYYSLEGYLFPDTYEFQNTNVTTKEIIETMLDHMGKKLEAYQSDIKSSTYSLHQMITLASIVELEASNSNERAGVAGVFYNRLTSKWPLGSDVTTYYAAKVDLSERDLYQSELNDYNDYNTRSSKMAGKLPIGPICNPGLDSLVAAIEPTTHQYYYFVADKNKKTYFSKTDKEHVKTVENLKKEGLWYEY